MAVSVVSFSFSRAAQPVAQGLLCWVMAFFIASYQHLLWTPTHQCPNGSSAWCGFPYHISCITPSNLQLYCNTTAWLLSWLSYIIVRRLLDLWNSMFNRHQAEITVMQFRGHSLPVCQSMSVPWEFFYLVPFHQPISAHAISSHNCH